MSKWYIVKKNWKTINKGYLGLGGDTWADIQIPFLFKDMDKLKDFLDLSKNADNIEELTCYRAVAIKRIVIE